MSVAPRTRTKAASIPSREVPDISPTMSIGASLTGSDRWRRAEQGSQPMIDGGKAAVRRLAVDPEELHRDRRAHRTAGAIDRRACHVPGHPEHRHHDPLASLVQLRVAG